MSLRKPPEKEVRDSTVRMKEVPRFYEEDEKKLVMIREFVEGLREGRAPFANTSYRRLKSLYVEFKDDVSIVVKMDCQVDGSTNITYALGTPEKADPEALQRLKGSTDEIPGGSDSHD